MSLLLLSLQSTPQLLDLENWPIDQLQSYQAARIAPYPSKITIVNDDTSMSIPGENYKNNAEPLATQIDALSTKFKPLGWIIAQRFTHNSSLLDRANTISDCTITNESSDRRYHSRSDLVCNHLAQNLQTYYQQLSHQEIRLNPYLLEKISSIDLSKIDELPVNKLTELLANKIIIVGDGSDKGSLDASVNRDALALDLIIRSRDPHQQLSLFSPWRNGMKLAWMLLWPVLIAVAMWQVRAAFLVSLAIGAWIAIAGILLIYAQEVPIVLSGFAIVIVCTAISIVKSISHSQVSS